MKESEIDVTEVLKDKKNVTDDDNQDSRTFERLPQGSAKIPICDENINDFIGIFNITEIEIENTNEVIGIFIAYGA